MPIQITSEQEVAVRELVRSGVYSDEREVIDAALSALKDGGRIRSRTPERAAPTIEWLRGRREAVDSDELVQTWFVHHIQIIGEAVWMLSDPAWRK